MLFVPGDSRKKFDGLVEPGADALSFESGDSVGAYAEVAARNLCDREVPLFRYANVSTALLT